MKIYHGSNAIVEKPEILKEGHFKDFGFGFYCTAIKRQAMKWALSKQGKHVVNSYEYRENTNLNCKIFSQMSDEWLDFVAACRSGIKHNFDIVEGPMADDTIWNYVEDFVAGKITRDAFWALAKFKYPTHQIVFCTDIAISLLRFITSEYYE